MCLLWKTLLFKKYRHTDRPYLFVVLSVDQKIYLVSPKVDLENIRNQSSVIEF